MPVETGAVDFSGGAGFVVLGGGELFPGAGLEAAGFELFEATVEGFLAGPLDGCFFADGVELLLLVFLLLKRPIFFDFAIGIESL